MLRCRYDERGGAAPGGARVPHAVPAELPRRALRDHAGVLAQGPAQAAHVRDAAVEAGGLLHHGQLGVQGGLRLLSPALPAASPTRARAPHAWPVPHAARATNAAQQCLHAAPADAPAGRAPGQPHAHAGAPAAAAPALDSDSAASGTDPDPAASGSQPDTVASGS
ncbi:unnamed protein product [Parnassius mnemosyne]|uniref:Uncharacterized protein n=1 Tax=Parnassius mnemosyne TaxID=213953 RepID=A0AAV1KS90_9NEOP